MKPHILIAAAVLLLCGGCVAHNYGDPYNSNQPYGHYYFPNSHSSSVYVPFFYPYRERFFYRDTFRDLRFRGHRDYDGVRDYRDRKRFRSYKDSDRSRFRSYKDSDRSRFRSYKDSDRDRYRSYKDGDRSRFRSYKDKDRSGFRGKHDRSGFRGHRGPGGRR
ncbi:MAG: hypothetical protein F9K32_14510 [Desulfobulbaceae bacterium]|nr:MAG: hypothetical protein F9K32_14510 [Desulfobulbaceae bacterium]